MSGDHDVCSKCGAEAMWCDCADEKQAERHHSPAAEGGEEVNNCKNCGCYFDELPKPEVEKALCHTCELAALRTENERLHEQVSSHAGWLWCSSEDLKWAEKRIAELEAALKEVEAEHPVPIEEMSVECLQQTLTWKMARAAAALKGDAE